MSPIVFNRWRYRYIFLFSFFLGFTLGLHFWSHSISDHCSSSFFPKPIVISSSSLFYTHFQYRTVKTCQNETSKIFLTIAVLSSLNRLVDYLPAILDSWILTTTVEIEIIIFLEDEEESTRIQEFLQHIFFTFHSRIPSCLFIVKLKHVKNEYPPQKKSFYALKFLYTYYRQRTSWILRLDDNAYVHIPELVRWLKSIDHQRALYLGQGGTGRANESQIHFPPSKYFCMGGSGIILSQQTLRLLGPWLDQCFQSELRTTHEDVEIGRCILTHVDISCTNAYDSKHLFYHHYGPGYDFGYDFTPTIVSRALILHPMKKADTFRQLSRFYRRRQSISPFPNNHPHRDPYVTFNNFMEFDLVRDIHYQLIDVRWKVRIDDAVRSYLEQLQHHWHHRSSNWTVISGNYILGYHRVIPTYGLELLVQILVNVRIVSSNSTVRSAMLRKHLHLRQPFVRKTQMDYREIIDEKDDQLHLIVVAKNKDQALTRFLENFQTEILDYPDRQRLFTLTILYFHENTSIIDQIHSLTVRYPSIIRLLIYNTSVHTYNRGLGRQLASQSFTGEQLLFFLDVDLIFTGQALLNTRRLLLHQLSLSMCAVYFPIIYSLFSNRFWAHQQQGVFSIYGYGNVALRKRDLTRVGGWETTNVDWGNEDVNLFQRFTNRSLQCQIFRSVQPGLTHSHHPKSCHRISNDLRKEMCYAAETNLFGAQGEMVDYILRESRTRFQ